MKIIIYGADCTGDAGNCLYPHRIEATNPAELAAVVSKDHVAAKYKGNYRNTENFEEAYVLEMDCDNDHSDNPEDWVTPEMLADDPDLADVQFATTPSRHNMLPKGSRSPRPRFHFHAVIERCCKPERLTEMKKALHQKYAFFDDNALDATRFMFGSAVTEDEVFWHDGWVTIDEVLTPDFDEDEYSYVGGDVIPEGCRNNTMSRFAGRVVKRYGATDRAYEIYLEESKKCDPPMEQEELQTIWNSACKFAKKVQSQDGYVAPEDYNSDFDNCSLKPSDYSDIGQAKLLVSEYGSELCFTEATDYLRYNGEVWNESRQQAVGAMEEFLDLQLADAEDEVESALKAIVALGEKEADVIDGGKKYVSGLSGDVLKAYYRYLGAVTYKAFVMKRRDMKYVTSALQAAKPMLQKNISDLDKDEFLLNTPGATYDLRQGVNGSRAPSFEDYITKQTTVAPGDTGKEIWLAAVQTFFCGDQSLIDYVQMICGLAAIGKVYVEALIIAYGGGRNGKSTFWNSISRVLGSYSGAISADTLTMGCRRNVKPEMAELKGKRLIIAAELEEGMRLNTSIVKQLSSTDEIEAEKKYKDPFKFVPSHLVVLYTNHLPKVGANDDGIWRRLIVIPFNAKIEGKSDIKNYTDYLVTNAGPAIMSWIIEGAKKAIDLKYHIPLPACVAAAIKAYRENNDWMSAFLEECCVLGKPLFAKSGELYQEYRAYCARSGEYTRSTTDFYTALEKYGFERRRTNKGSFIYGLELKSDFLE